MHVLLLVRSLKVGGASLTLSLSRSHTHTHTFLFFFFFFFFVFLLLILLLGFRSLCVCVCARAPYTYDFNTRHAHRYTVPGSAWVAIATDNSTCNVYEKAKAAQEAGASALIVHRVVPLSALPGHSPRPLASLLSLRLM